MFCFTSPSVVTVPGSRLIKSELEPHMRAQSPTMIGGLSFERLSFGHLPMSILGVRHVPSWNADNLGIGVPISLSHAVWRCSLCLPWVNARPHRRMKTPSFSVRE